MTINYGLCGLVIDLDAIGRSSHSAISDGGGLSGESGIGRVGHSYGMSRRTFDALPYYDEDGSNNPDLLAKVKAELAREQKRIGQRVAPDNDPRIPPQFPLFSVRYVQLLCYNGPLTRALHCRKTRCWLLSWSGSRLTKR